MKQELRVTWTVSFEDVSGFRVTVTVEGSDLRAVMQEAARVLVYAKQRKSTAKE